MRFQSSTSRSERRRKAGSKGFSQGVAAEYVAAFLLFIKGYKIVKRRFPSHFGEVDIIAIRNKTLVGVEVKKRPTIQAGREAIQPKQRERIENGLADFLAHNERFSDFSVRFDAIIVAPLRLPVHITDAWRP